MSIALKEKTRIDWRHYSSRDAQAKTLADEVAQTLNDSLSAHSRGAFAVPGGTTPADFLRALAARPVDWRLMSMTLTDERWVPADHPRSNERLLRENFLNEATAQVDFTPIYNINDDGSRNLRIVNQDLRERCFPLDVLVLGMGNDGHCASLFPGGSRLSEALSPTARLALPMQAPGAEEFRVTLTLPMLLSALQIHLLIAGADKKATLERALEDGPVEEMPIRAVLRGASSPVIVHYAE